MPKIPTQQRATTNKQKVYFRATRMRENVRQKSTAQISRQTCVAQQNVQAVCKRVLVWFAICNSQSVKQPPTTHLFCCQARFFAICAWEFFCRHTNSLLRVLHTKIFFLHCLGQGFNVNFAVCRLVCVSRTFFAICAWETIFLSARKLPIMSLARERNIFCIASGEVST